MLAPQMTEPPGTTERVTSAVGRRRGRDLLGAPSPPACTSYLQVGLKSS